MSEDEVTEFGRLMVVKVIGIDDLSDEVLAALPVEYQDGVHDRQDRAPEIVSFL